MTTRIWRLVAIGLTLAPLACMHGGAAQERSGTTTGSTGTSGEEQAGAAATTGSTGTSGRETEAGASPSETPSGARAARPGEPGMLPDSAESDPAERGAATKTVIGTVEEGDGGSLMLRSSKLSDPYRVTIGDDTRLVHEGEVISREEIAEGDQVRATYVGEENAGTATEIAVIRKGDGKAVTGTERDVAGEQDREQAAPQQPSRSQ